MKNTILFLTFILFTLGYPGSLGAETAYTGVDKFNIQATDKNLLKLGLEWAKERKFEVMRVVPADGTGGVVLISMECAGGTEEDVACDVNVSFHRLAMLGLTKTKHPVIISIQYAVVPRTEVTRTIKEFLSTLGNFLTEEQPSA
jgi:hypothetical protein